MVLSPHPFYSICVIKLYYTWISFCSKYPSSLHLVNRHHVYLNVFALLLSAQTWLLKDWTFPLFTRFGVTIFNELEEQLEWVQNGKVTSMVAKKEDYNLAAKIEEAIMKNERLESLTVDYFKRDTGQVKNYISEYS